MLDSSSQNALERRDAEAILNLCSTQYFEDNANTDPNDDYGYKALKEKIIPEIMKNLDELHIDLEVKEINVKKGRATADFRFFYKAKFNLPAGEKWNVDTEINRIELLQEKDGWKITSGLWYDLFSRVRKIMPA